MDWLLPLLSSGTVFYFDDFWSYQGHPDFGELKFINEFNASGKGYLTQFHQLYPYNQRALEMAGEVYMFARKEWEYKKTSMWCK